MLVRAEIVTPHTAPSVLDRIEDGDRTIEHLCLELVHWGFANAMAWVYKVHAVCRQNPGVDPPMISIHHDADDLLREQVDAVNRSGVLWMPRTEEKNLGKDPATIIHEMLACKTKPSRPSVIDPMIEELISQDPELVYDLPDEEFQRILAEVMEPSR